MSRSTETRDPSFALMLICEGTRTEPNFFYCLCKDMKEQGVLGCTFKVLPKSSFETEDEEVNADRGDRKRTTREVLPGKPMKESPNPQFPGEQPLNWVKAGLDFLSTYNEVWCIFDKDGHPKQKEAFELVKESQTENKNINIAFSSRSIEYYFLLHFEYIYKAFEKSECNEKQYKGKKPKTVYFKCMTENAIKGKACDGSKCINGYARKKGYWVESKSNTSLYPILKDRLFKGIVNSIRLRKESHQINPESVIYERNPYITTDYLVARILGYSIQENKTFDIKTNGTSIRVNLDGNTVSFYNEGTISYILQSGCIRLLDPFNNTHTSYNDRPILIEPTKSYSISLADKQEDHLLMLYISDENYIIG